MGVREERRLAAREGILAAAHRQAAEAGLASATVTTVAARAGVASGSLYRHFPSRGALLAAVVGDALRGEQALLDRAVAASATSVAALEAWVRTAVGRGRQAPVLTWALLHEPGGGEVEQVRASARRRREDALSTLIRAGADTGAWPAGPVDLQAAAILGACDATQTRRPADRHADGEAARRPADDTERERSASDDLAAALAAFCLGGLGAPGHPRPG